MVNYGQRQAGDENLSALQIVSGRYNEKQSSLYIPENGILYFLNSRVSQLFPRSVGTQLLSNLSIHRYYRSTNLSRY